MLRAGTDIIYSTSFLRLTLTIQQQCRIYLQTKYNITTIVCYKFRTSSLLNNDPQWASPLPDKMILKVFIWRVKEQPYLHQNQDPSVSATQLDDIAILTLLTLILSVSKLLRENFKNTFKIFWIKFHKNQRVYTVYSC